MTKADIYAWMDAFWAVYGVRERQYMVTDPLTAPDGARVGDIVSYREPPALKVLPLTD